MELEKLIKERRSVTSYDTSKELPIAEIKAMLDASVWVPNHKMTQPWRFVLIHGETKKELAELHAKQGAKGDTPEERKQRAELAFNKINDVPLWIAVVMNEQPNLKLREEDYASTSMVIYNFSLLAWQKGIGTIWKTNGLLENPKARDLLGIKPGERNIGLVQVGYIGKIPKTKPRKPGIDLITELD